MIKVENTAISNGYSKSAKLLGENTEIKNILDYGCGRLRNSFYLINKGKKLTIIDTPFQLENIKDLITKDISILEDECDFDAILCSFVLNVIPDLYTRCFVLKNIEKLLSNNGLAYIEVRTNSFLSQSKTAIKYKDGYLLGKNKYKTFQKPFYKKELINFINNATKLTIVNVLEYKDSIIAICKKENPI